MEFIAEAIEKTGYIFDGWFAGDELLTNNPVYKTLLSFNDIGKTIVARYHAIPKPDPKPQPKPDTKPSGKGCTDADKTSTIHLVNTDMVNTAAYGNTHSRKTVVPNTSDSNLGWLILMLCFLLTASGAVVALKKN